MKVLTKSLLSVGALALASAPLPASANPCGNTTYNNWLVSGFSCTIGNQTYSEFSFNSVTVTANQISVGPDPSAPAGSFGLVFSSSALSVLGAGTVDIALDYTVTTPTALLDDAFLTIAGVVTGNGSATVGETITPSGITLTACLPATATCNATDHEFFPLTDQVGVLKDALVISLTGTTSISAIENDISEVVPIPGTFPLLATGLVGLWGLGRRQRKQSGAPLAA